MPDFMKLWYKGYRRKRAIRRVKEELYSIDIILSTSDSDFQWPHSKYIVQLQRSSKTLKGINKENDGIWTVEGGIWVPD